MPIPRISVEVFLPSMSWNHLHHGQASIWQSSSCSILNWSSEPKNSHKDGCEHTILLRNTPTDIPTQPLSAILLEAFDREIPLRKEWPEKLTTDLCLLKSRKSSDLQKIRREISHSYKLQCRCWHLGYSALTDEFSILLVKEWMQKKKKYLIATCRQCWYHLISPIFIFSFLQMQQNGERTSCLKDKLKSCQVFPH